MWEEPGSLRARRLELWSAALEEAQLGVDSGDLEAAHDAAHVAYETAWRSGRQFVVDDAATEIIGRLECDSPACLRSVLLKGYSEAGRLATVQPCEGIGECLKALRDAGALLGVVCDIGLTPSGGRRELLTRERLLDYFDDTTFSDEVGTTNPTQRSSVTHFSGSMTCRRTAPPCGRPPADRRRLARQPWACSPSVTTGVYEDEHDGRGRRPHRRDDPRCSLLLIPTSTVSRTDASSRKVRVPPTRGRGDRGRGRPARRGPASSCSSRDPRRLQGPCRTTGAALPASSRARSPRP